MVAVTDRQTEERDSERLGKMFVERVFTGRKECVCDPMKGSLQFGILSENSQQNFQGTGPALTPIF